LTTPRVCVAHPRLHRSTTDFIDIFWSTAGGTPPGLARGARLWPCQVVGTRRSRDAAPSAVALGRSSPAVRSNGYSTRQRQ
jgi:hypothetical protein